MKIHHQVLIIGGGWAGVSAALMAQKTGADTAICERTDMLLGAGLVGGIMRNNGRFTAAEECIEMGCGELFKLTDSISRHKNLDFPGHRHASLYDVHAAEPAVKQLLLKRGISLYFQNRITWVNCKGDRLIEVQSENGNLFSAESFVDATGSFGPPGICTRYGNGCASCIQRCPCFGPRVSIAKLMGLPEYMTCRRKNLPGAMSGSCKIEKQTLSSLIRHELESKGVVTIPLPNNMVHRDKLRTKVCQQYALTEYAQSLVLLDTGHAKLMTSYFPLEDLRSVSGLENARYADPLGAGIGNSIRLTAVTPRYNTLLAMGAQNLFVAGEKVGVCVGHTEAIVTGAVAGRNAGLSIQDKTLITIPSSLTTGDFIKFSAIDQHGDPAVEGGFGLSASHTFAGSVYFDRMKQLGLYTTNELEIEKRVLKSGMTDVFNS